MTEKNPYAVGLGRLGGLKKSERKTAAARANSQKAGRPRKPLDPSLIAPAALTAFLWERIEAVLRAHGPLPLAALKPHVREFIAQKTERRIDAVILTEIGRRPSLFKNTRDGYIVTGPKPASTIASACAHCGGPMPSLEGRRQSAAWRSKYCRRWCSRAAEYASGYPYPRGAR